MKLCNHKTGRLVAALACAWLLGGCTTMGGDAGAVYALASRMWNGGDRITRDQAAAVPYASIGLNLGRSNQIMLVLATYDHDQQLWTSADHIAIVTAASRVVRTAGLPYNLSGTQPRHDRANATFTWQADFRDISLFAVPITCHTAPPVDDAIVILGTALQSRRTDEECTADSRILNWSFTNSFWSDPQTDIVWKSVQHIHPRSDPVTIELFRPY